MAQEPSKETNAAIYIRHTNKRSRAAQEYRCVTYAESQGYSVTDFIGTKRATTGSMTSWRTVTRRGGAT